MSDRLRVGVVGCGIGKAHIEAYRSLPEQFQVAAVCDIDEARARDVAEANAIPLALTDFGELCRMDELDVIDICTPPYLHCGQTLQALAAGRHVICEKPLAGSLAQVDQVIVAEQGSGRRVMPIFQYRFGHGIQRLKFLVDQGVAGRAYLTTVETAWRRRPAYYAVPWRARWKTELGGPLVNQAIHAHDLAYYVLGPARRVSGHLATLVNPVETEDCVVASLEMTDGSLCALSVTVGSAAEISRHRFCFEHLTAESNTEPYSNSRDPWRFTGDSPELDERIREALSRFSPLPEHFAGQFYRYNLALRAGTAFPVTLADARAAIELITAIYHAARTRQPVCLPIADDHPLYGGWQP
jgi:predicted dehydrogenase